MNIPKWFKPLYIVAALYDGILGILFLVVPIALFNAANITPPNHIGYVQFPAFLLIVFAIMFFNIARDPVRNKNLILYGILLKLSYCSVVFPHWLTGQMPSIWVPFAFFDLIFLVIFIISARVISKVS